MKRIAFIDILKALSIFLVIIFHLFYQLYPSNFLRPLGFIGVSLFIIVSGFLLAKKYPLQEKFSFRWFFKRFFKIALVYYSTLIILVLLFYKQTYQGNTFLTLISHFTFIDPFLQNYAYTIISPAWFLTPLIAFYFLFPWLNKYSKKSNLFIIASFIISIVYRILNPDYFTSPNPLFFLSDFVFGISLVHKKDKTLLKYSLLFLLIPLFDILNNSRFGLLRILMILPFFLFYLFSKLKIDNAPKIIGIISLNTLVLFLIHESFIKVSLNIWSIYGLNSILSLIILILASLLIIKLNNIKLAKSDKSSKSIIN